MIIFNNLVVFNYSLIFEKLSLLEYLIIKTILHSNDKESNVSRLSLIVKFWDELISVTHQSQF